MRRTGPGIIPDCVDLRIAVGLRPAAVFYVAWCPETLDWPSLVRRITCPVLLIRADPALGGIVTAEDAAALQVLVPTARVAHISGAGHAVRRGQFGRDVEAVHAFLRK